MLTWCISPPKAVFVVFGQAEALWSAFGVVVTKEKIGEDWCTD